MKRLDIYIEKSDKSFSFKYSQIFMILYGVICIVMHLIRVFDNSFWGDEGFAVNAARMSFSGMIQYVADEGHTPFYYVYLWLVRAMFGDSGTMYHLSSLVPYILIIIVALTVVRMWFGNGVSLVLMTCAAFLDSAVTYNLEVRMYAWCELFILIAFLCTYKIYRDDSSFCYVLMSIVSIGAVYGHYFSLGTIGLLYAVLLVYKFLAQKNSIWKVFVSGASVLVAFLPWIIYCKSTQGNVMRDYNMQAATWKESLEFVFHSRYSFLLLFLFFVFLFIYVAYETGMLKIIENKENIAVHITNSIEFSLEKTKLIWVIGGFISVFGTLFVAKAISSFIFPILNLRYIYISYVIIWLIFGIAISFCRFKRFYTGIICIFIIISCLPNYISVVRLERECNARLADTLSKTSDIDENDIITTNNVHFDWTVEQVYYPDTPRQLFVGADLPKFDMNKDNWLFLDSIITPEVIGALEEQGLYAEDFLNEGYIGIGNIWIYRVLKK